MNREKIIQMAREAGWTGPEDNLAYVSMLEAFAKLVIKPWADQLEVERKKFQELNDIAVVGMQHARIAEREACAKVCEELYDTGLMMAPASPVLAAKIRARGQA